MSDDFKNINELKMPESWGLTRSEETVLRMLLGSRHFVTTEQIQTELYSGRWGPEAEMSDSKGMAKLFISKLRKKVPQLVISSSHGCGYIIPEKEGSIILADMVDYTASYKSGDLVEISPYRYEPVNISDVVVLNGGLSGVPSVPSETIPEVRMLNVDRLGIDFSYQRIVTWRGRKNIRQIIENFNWIYFQPILVAPASPDDGSFDYLVIDGQHRALAAYNHPDIKKIPACIVDADFKQQSKVFYDINTHKVELMPLEVFWSSYHAGEPWAGTVVDIIDEAGLKLSKHMPYSLQSIDDWSKYKKQIYTPKRLHNYIVKYNSARVISVLKFVDLWEEGHSEILNSIPILDGLLMALVQGKSDKVYPSVSDAIIGGFSAFDVIDDVKEKSARRFEKRKPAQIACEEWFLPAMQGGVKNLA